MHIAQAASVLPKISSCQSLSSVDEASIHEFRKESTGKKPQKSREIPEQYLPASLVHRGPGRLFALEHARGIVISVRIRDS